MVFKKNGIMFSIVKQQTYEILLTKFDVFLKLNQLFLFCSFSESSTTLNLSVSHYYRSIKNISF